MARGPLCSSPEPTHTLDHRADPLGTGARCAATRVSAGVVFFPSNNKRMRRRSDMRSDMRMR